MAYVFPDGFKIGGVTSSSLSLIMIDKDIPAMPEIEEQAEEMPGIDGGYDFGVRYKPKIIEVKVRILNSPTKSAYNDAVRRLTAVLNPRLGSQELIFDDDPSVLYYARISETFNPKRMALISEEFTLTFICYDPFTYATTEKTVNLTGSSVVINHLGAHVSRPTLTINKTAGVGTVKIVYSDSSTETISFNSSSPAGTYIINGKEKTSLLSNGSGAYKYIDNEIYFEMQPGNNTISKTGSITDVAIKYRDTWL